MVLSNAQWFANPSTTYEIDQSCRFNDDDSAYLYKTPDATNQKTWTFSTWFKIGNLGINKTFLAAGTDGGGTGAGYTVLRISDSDEIYFEYYASSAAVWKYVSNQVLRDPGAWYHLVVAVDTTQGTASNRIKIYLNGSEVTSFSTETDPSADTTGNVGKNILHRVGSSSWGVSSLFDGYMAETVYIDGTQLTPSSFGETNSTTGQWVPKSVSGLTFGTEGFLFAYQDSSALGDDTSGNGNDWTSSGLAAADQMTDSPTDNFCTLNPLTGNASITYSDGNLSPGRDGTSFQTYFGTQALPSTGKWYWEITAIGATAPIGPGAGWDGTVGIGTRDADDNPQGESTNWVWGNAQTTAAGQKHNGSSINLYPASSLTDNSIVMTAVDMDNSKIWWGVDGSWMGTDSGDNDGNPATGANPAFANLSGELFPLGNRQDDYEIYNFGQQSFAHTPPSGFKALSTANLDDPTIADPSAYFQPTIYTGDGASSLAVNQGGNSTFEPDFVWIKNRDAADNHCWFDSVRGVTKLLSSNNTDAESTDADTLTAFDSDGFTVGADVKVNTNTEKYVGWQWLEDTTSAFDMVTYTGTGSTRTVAHNLGVKPDLMIFKRRNGTQNWQVYHSALTAYYKLFLDLTLAKVDDTDSFNDTEPTSSVFTVKSDGTVNATDDTYIAWLFAGVEGFSKFGSYVGNGSTDGPFVSLGFKPSALIVKRASPEYPAAGGGWPMWDNARSTYNVNNHVIEADATNAGDGAEWTAAWTYIDFLSNGFKIRGNDTETNADGSTYVFAAWADTPFKTALAR